MKTRLLFLYDLLRTTFWFIPALMLAGSVVLALALIGFDRAIHDEVENAWGWGYTGGPDGARLVLSTIAGSMITVAGVAFSITIVALTLASSQFGPRLLRNFIRDRGNQVVLGTFLATFLFCLLVLRTVRDDGQGEFVPSVSVFVGVLLAVFSLSVLIYFIHHVATSIQATRIIANVSDELLATIDRNFPEEIGEGLEGKQAPRRAHDLPPAAEGRSIVASRSGYLQTVNSELLLRLARHNDLLIHLEMRPGAFLIQNDRLGTAWPAERATDDVLRALTSAHILGPERTTLQDVEFGVAQLVEVAVRSLSPGINDPFTAINCIDRLGEAFCRLVGREMPSPLRTDDTGALRVVAPAPALEPLLETALNPICYYGRDSASVLLRALNMLQRVGQHVRREDDHTVLHRQIDQVLERGLAGVCDPIDRARLREWSSSYSDESSAAKLGASGKT
jgi:uncharacterized membrane protein